MRSQIWIAICVYLMLACLNKIHRIEESLSRVMQILSVNTFQKVPIQELLTSYSTQKEAIGEYKQLSFSDL